MNMPLDLTEVEARVNEKWQHFREYNFGTLKDDALKTFYDLAQEYETIENLYRVAVTVIKEFFELNSRLYLICAEGNLDLVCDSLQGVYHSKTPPLPHIHLDSQAYEADNSLVIPIRGNLLLVNQLPFYAKDQVIGMLELFPGIKFQPTISFSSRSLPTAWATTCTSRSSPGRIFNTSALLTVWWPISNITSSSPISASVSTSDI